MSELLYQRLDTTGDGSGTTNMNVDGSITPITFKIKPSGGQLIKVARIIILVEDTGTFDSDKWGNGITLANGFNFKHKKSGITTDLLGFSIKTTGEMSSICHDLDHRSFGTGNEFVSFRLTFTKAGSTINLYNDDELQLVVNDDMTDLVKMYVHAQGVYG
jgi:hypothetical protein